MKRDRKKFSMINMNLCTYKMKIARSNLEVYCCNIQFAKGKRQVGGKPET